MIRDHVSTICAQTSGPEWCFCLDIHILSQFTQSQIRWRHKVGETTFVIYEASSPPSFQALCLCLVGWPRTPASPPANPTSINVYRLFVQSPPSSSHFSPPSGFSRTGSPWSVVESHVDVRANEHLSAFTGSAADPRRARKHGPRHRAGVDPTRLHGDCPTHTCPQSQRSGASPSWAPPAW